MSQLLADPESAFHLISGVVLLVALGVVVHCRPAWAIALFVALIATSTDLREPLFAPVISVVGLQVGLLDGLVTVMLCSAAYRVAVGRALCGAQLAPISVLVGLLMVNMLRGMASFGVQLAVNEARASIYLLAALAFTATAPVRGPRWWIVMGLGYCGWLIYWTVSGFEATGLHPVTSYIEIGGELTDPRPVTAAGAVVLAQVMLVLVAVRTRRRHLFAAAVLGATLVVLQHRTVWFAGVAGLAYLGLRALRDGGRGRLAALLAAAAATTGTLALVLSGIAQRSAVAVSAENVTASDNTLNWRVTGWVALLQDRTTVVGVLTGHPFGEGFRRVVGGQVVVVSPHSHYVETVLRFGLLGLAASVALFWLAWRGAVSLGPAARPPRAVLIALAVFALTYRCDPLQGVLLGTVLGLSRTPTPDADRPSSPVSRARVPATRVPAVVG